MGAARRINLGRRSEVEKLRLRRSIPAQQLAWKHYDAIGEVKYAFNYVANILSRVRLYAAYVPDDRDGPPVPIGAVGGLDRDLVTSARYEVAKLDTAHGGQPGLIRNFALNYQVAGECFLIEIGDKLGIYSSEELHVEGTPARSDQASRSSGVYLQPRRDMQTQERIPLTEDTFIARIWRQHPAYSEEPDSSLFGVAESAEELLMLGRSIRASALSQINAGLLYVAEELSFQKAADVEANAQDNAPESDEGEEDAFEEEFNLHMTEPTDDDMSAASVLPLLVRGPADLAETAIKKIDLSRQFDEKAVTLRENALSRVLNGIDIPKDLVTGLSSVRYSNAQQIDENLYKAHVEPSAVTLCEAITVTRLRPALIARGFDADKVARVVCWYDASEVVTNANRSKDADAGHDRFLISDAAWRRDHGYSDQDKPTDDELVRRLAQKNPLAPETVIQMMAALIPLIGEMAKQHQIVLQPTSMTPQMPPRSHSQPQQAALPGGSAQGGGGAQPASSSGAPPPPEGTPAPVAAAGNVRHIADAEVKRLLDVERKLRTSLQMLLSDMTDRALEKAGSRLASKVRGNPELSAKIKNVPKGMVASVLGRDAVTAAGYTDQQLIQDSVDETEPKYRQQVLQAQKQAARILGLPSFGLPGDLDGSWAILKPMLIAFVARALFRKERDEYVPKVSMDDIRTALARAGGSQPKRPTNDGPQPGAILNDAAFQVLAEKHGAEHDGYRWVYGISDNHFQPHLDLDGKSFAGWDDPVLRNPGTFPKVQFLHPGDHNGCECDWLPLFVPRLPHEGRVVEHR